MISFKRIGVEMVVVVQRADILDLKLYIGDDDGSKYGIAQSSCSL